METRSSKRSKVETTVPEECVVCMDAPATVLQRECGHTVLCVNCAFRVQIMFRRACPMCRAPILCPLVSADGYVTNALDPAAAAGVINYARAVIMHGNHRADHISHAPMLNSLEGIMPLMPDSCAKVRE